MKRNAPEVLRKLALKHATRAVELCEEAKAAEARARRYLEIANKLERNRL
jgi:hypothetical protein